MDHDCLRVIHFQHSEGTGRKRCRDWNWSGRVYRYCYQASSRLNTSPYMRLSFTQHAAPFWLLNYLSIFSGSKSHPWYDSCFAVKPLNWAIFSQTPELCTYRIFYLFPSQCYYQWVGYLFCICRSCSSMTLNTTALFDFLSLRFSILTTCFRRETEASVDV